MTHTERLERFNRASHSDALPEMQLETEAVHKVARPRASLFDIIIRAYMVAITVAGCAFSAGAFQ